MRRQDLIGELQLLVLQLPTVGPDDPDYDDVVALRAVLLELVTEISIAVDRAGLTSALRSPISAAVGPD